MVEDLTSLKGSGKLAPEQTKQVDDLLPRANSLTSELAKPQVETSKLTQSRGTCPTSRSRSPR